MLDKITFPAVFRPSTENSPYRNIRKTLLQAFCLWVIFLALIPWLISSFEEQWGIPHLNFPYQFPAAVILFLIASVINLWSGLTMAIKGAGTPLPLDCCRTLVITGPYQYVRNPMAIAGLMQGFAIALGTGSFGIGMYVIAGMLLWNMCIRPIEEQDMLIRFGRNYADYRDRVRCWIPHGKAYHGLE